MAAFGEKTFSHARYAANRPVYPQTLYDLILKYHEGPRDLLLDLGCGHGLSTRALAPQYARALGTDLSEHMLSLARSLTTNKTQDSSSTSPSLTPNIDFQEASSNALPFLPSSSVSTVIASQAAHWFSYPSTWQEAARVVRPGGTLAFWGYSDPVLLGRLAATRILHRYAYERGCGSAASGSGLDGNGGEPEGKKEGCMQEWMGGYWGMPGRATVENLYRSLVPTEEDGWGDVERVESSPRADGSGTVVERTRGGGNKVSEDGGFVMRKPMRVKDFKEYIRTWSAYHNWEKTHPEARKRTVGEGEGDVVDWMADAMCEEDEDLADEDHELLVEWPVGLLLARRR